MQKPNTEATETGDPLGHQYAELEEKRIDPTCTEDGEKTLKCNVCGDEKVETIPATGHIESSTFVPHTCTEGGKEVITCAVCKVELAVNDLSDLDPAPATGHVPGEAVRENEEAATCKEDGGYDTVVLTPLTLHLERTIDLGLSPDADNTQYAEKMEQLGAMETPEITITLTDGSSYPILDASWQPTENAALGQYGTLALSTSGQEQEDGSAVISHTLLFTQPVQLRDVASVTIDGQIYTVK